MHLLAIFSALLLALAPFATPNPFPHDDDDSWDGKDGHEHREGCLTDKSAAKIVSTFVQFFVKINSDTAMKSLTSDFTIYSDSTNFVTPTASKVPGAATVSSRQAFIDAQIKTQQSGPQPGFTTLGVYHSCDSITFRWHLNQPVIVAGIDVLIIKPGTHLIQTDYSEYNDIALLANFGCFPKGGACG